MSTESSRTAGRSVDRLTHGEVIATLQHAGTSFSMTLSSEPRPTVPSNPAPISEPLSQGKVAGRVKRWFRSFADRFVFVLDAARRLLESGC